jgi:hypothetical protein
MAGIHALFNRSPASLCRRNQLNKDPRVETSLDFSVAGRLLIRAVSPAAAGYLRERWQLSEATGAGQHLCELEVDGGGHFDPAWERLELGGRCRMPEGTRVDDLLPVLSLLALHTGALPLHASAFVLGDHGIVYAGPAHSGKTGVLLAAAEVGGVVIGDECVWLADDCRRVYGFPVPLEVRLRYIREFPDYEQKLPSVPLWAARLCGLLAHVTSPVEALRRRFEARSKVFIEPGRLFCKQSRASYASCDHLFLSQYVHANVYEVRKAGVVEARAALADLVLSEFESIIGQYPQAPLLAGARQAVLQAVDGALDNKRVHFLCHPYPAEAWRMLAAMRTVL